MNQSSTTADGIFFGVGIASLIFFSLWPFTKNGSRRLLRFIALAYAGALSTDSTDSLTPPVSASGVFRDFPHLGTNLADLCPTCHSYRTSCGGIFSALMVIITSVLMISNIPYLHFGQSLWPNTPRAIKMLLCILMIIFICVTFAHKIYRPAFVWWCFGISLVYTFCGISWRLIIKPKNKGTYPPTDTE